MGSSWDIGRYSFHPVSTGPPRATETSIYPSRLWKSSPSCLLQTIQQSVGSCTAELEKRLLEQNRRKGLCRRSEAMTGWCDLLLPVWECHDIRTITKSHLSRGLLLVLVIARRVVFWL